MIAKFLIHNSRVVSKEDGDGNGNENDKKSIGFVLAKQQFFNHVHDHGYDRMKLPNFTRLFIE